MEWEDKTTMVKLGNAMNDDATHDPEKVKAFQDFVSGKIKEFDAQAMDMFITIIELFPDEIKKHIEFYLPVYDKLQEMLKNPDISFGLRTAMRLSMFEVIVEEAVIDK
jgi:hypothetical protein